MELEISIEDLLNKRRVESDRIEFKAGWNPDDIYHSVCAFANDFDNVGGGYILIGVEEKNGIAVRPVKGVDEQEIDRIQKELLGYNNTIIPAYFPKVVIEKVDEKMIMVLWVTTGIQRPYKVPEHVTAKKEKKHYYYIRYASNSVHVNPEQERELINMTNYAPLDARPNFDATENDISVALLIDHLNETKSKLAKQVTERGVMAVLNDMQLLVGPPEQQYISNAALMMFCEHLDKFFPYTQVEIVRFPDGSIKNPNNFKEFPVIKGSVPMMIKRTMQTLQDLVIEEMVTKVNYQMEAIRRFNYPYQALEEVVVNAFYHALWKAFHNLCYAKLFIMQSYLGIAHKYRQSRVFTLHNILQVLFQPVNQIFLFFFAVSVRCFDSRPMFSQLFFLDFRIGLSVNFGSDNRRMAQQIADIN